MGRIHADYLAGSPVAELVACCDPGLRPSDAVPGGVICESLEEAIAAFDLEAVVIATPPDRHRDVVVTALEHDLHVLCEKPIAHDLAATDAMIAAAGASSGRLVVGHNRRFDPRFTAIAAAVADGRIGRPVQLRGGTNCPREDAVRLAPTTTLALECGVHDLDAMRWLAGDIERVHAEGADFFPTPGVDAFVATIRFVSGAVGSISHSWVMPDETPIDWEFHFHVGGVNGIGEIDGRSRGVTVLSPDRDPLHPDTASWPRLHGLVGGALAIEDAHFLAGVRGDRPWPLLLDDARAAIAAALAVDRSIEEGRPIDLSELS